MSRAIDRALTDFVDRLNAGEAPEVAAYMQFMNPEEYKEFKELAKTTHVLKWALSSVGSPEEFSQLRAREGRKAALDEFTAKVGRRPCLSASSSSLGFK